MLSLSCIIRYASNLRKSVEIFENLTLLLEKKNQVVYNKGLKELLFSICTLTKAVT